MFEYRVSSRDVRVSSRVVRVSSQGDNEFIALIIFQLHIHVNLAGLLLEKSRNSRGGKRLYICKSVDLFKSIRFEVIIVHF